MPETDTQKGLRLTGIDLFRGVGAFAVAILHSGDASNSFTIDEGAVALRQFCSFVVPFFLITSFYLVIHRFSVTGKSYSIQSRVQRLLLPYAFWSIVYLVVRSAKFLLLHEADGFEKISDIISVIFFGAASVPLYFIPLLFIGSLLLIVVEFLIKRKIPFYAIFLLFLGSTIGYQIIVDSNNYFQLGSNIAFEGVTAIIAPNLNQNQFLRILLVFLEWLMQCAPYVFAAMALNHLLLRYHPKKVPKILAWGSLIVFLGLSFLGKNWLPSVIYTVSRAIALFLFSIQISTQLPVSSWIQSLGQCSFGIYLMHYLIIQVLRVLLGKFQPELVSHLSIASQLLFASLSFSSSWFIVAYLVRKKQLAKIMFGI
jgi:peptidoglycan/LPS O-acetylase OafA/YrhL